jgi:carbamate kinase
VIDKDLAGERLASLIGADRFVILTDVDAAYINYKKSNQKKIVAISSKEAKEYYSNGYFGEGSMAPKILAAIRFVESGGKESIIAEISDLTEALAGRAGSHIRE